MQQCTHTNAVKHNRFTHISHTHHTQSASFTEDSPKGRDYLAEVCAEWEAAANKVWFEHVSNCLSGAKGQQRVKDTAHDLWVFFAGPAAVGGQSGAPQQRSMQRAADLRASCWLLFIHSF